MVAVVLALALTTPVSAAVPGLERIVKQSESDSSTPKAEDTFCPLGKRLLGAGGDITGGLGAVNMTLAPASTLRAGVFAVENTGGTDANWSIRAYSICADPLPGLQVVHVDGPRNSKRSKHITAKCPAGTRLLGTGGEVNIRGQVVINSLIPDPELTKVTVRGAEDQDGAPHNWFISAYAICADPLPGLQLVRAASGLSSTAFRSTRAECPAGKALVGTGGRIIGGPPAAGQVVMDGDAERRSTVAGGHDRRRLVTHHRIGYAMAASLLAQSGMQSGLRCHRGARARARRNAARRLTDQSLSAPAHAAKDSPPTVPVTVSSTPAAAAAATPSLPRMSTAAAAPTLGPTGS
jgi:hypothetical protein